VKRSGIVATLGGTDDLLFVLHKQEKEPSRSVEKLNSTSSQCISRFSRSKGEWLECAELLDGLKEPGHQYLSRGSGDEAVVVVSYRENLTSKV
jgi:hypothetical protein